MNYHLTPKIKESLLKRHLALRVIRALKIALYGNEDVYVSPSLYIFSKEYQIIRRFYLYTEKRKDKAKFFNALQEIAPQFGSDIEEVGREIIAKLVLEETEDSGLVLRREGNELILVRNRSFVPKSMRHNYVD